jgi:uncharacterized protein (DUF1330 family)
MKNNPAGGMLMRSVYVVAETSATDVKLLQEYRKLARESVKAFSGEYIVAGGAIEMLAGSELPERFAVVRFDSLQTAKNWWDSEQYREAKMLRRKMGVSRIFIVEGV